MKRILASILIAAFLCFALVGCGGKTDGGSNPDNTSGDAEGYTVTFTCDEHVNVLVYNTQDMSGTGTDTNTAYSRDGSTGEKLKDGNGQVNFKLVFDDGYKLDDIDISAGYTNLKGPSDTAVANGYRITKITADLTVAVTSKEESDGDGDEQGFEVTFDCDEHVSVLVYKTQDMSGDGEATDVAYSRDGDTGEKLDDGEGQVNFKLVFDGGYKLDEITVTEGYKNLKGPADTEVENGYRITKITDDLTVTVTSKQESEGEDLTDGFEVTFDCDDHVSVLVYKTQDMSGDGEATDVAYSRNSSTGALTKTDGQVNFKLVFDNGYEIKKIVIDGTYNNLKGGAEIDAENGYRITKIEDDLTVTVTSQVEGTPEDPDDGYKVTFDCDDHVSVLVYKTQDMSGDGESTYTAYSRAGDTGEGWLLNDGNGQVNFILVFDDGYELDDIDITDGYKNLKYPVDTGYENGYRITKIEDDLTVTVTSKQEGAAEDLTQGNKVTFVYGDHVSVTVYRTQADMKADTDGDEQATVAYSRDGDSGKLVLKDGQVNFVLVIEEGYEVESIVITPVEGYNQIKTSAEKTVENSYRITKITAEITVTITVKAKD